MISTHLNPLESIEKAYKYKNWDIISVSRGEILKLASFGNIFFAIFACSLDRFLDYRKYTCVKDLTNIMSGHISTTWWLFWSQICLCRFHSPVDQPAARVVAHNPEGALQSTYREGGSCNVLNSVRQ